MHISLWKTYLTHFALVTLWTFGVLIQIVWFIYVCTYVHSCKLIVGVSVCVDICIYIYICIYISVEPRHSWACVWGWRWMCVCVCSDKSEVRSKVWKRDKKSESGEKFLICFFYVYPKLTPGEPWSGQKGSSHFKYPKFRWSISGNGWRFLDPYIWVGFCGKDQIIPG